MAASEIRFVQEERMRPPSVIRALCGLWIAFLTVAFISTQLVTAHDFGGDNMVRLGPPAADVVIVVTDGLDAIGLDFSSVAEAYASVDPDRSGPGTGIQHINPYHPEWTDALLVFGLWALVGLVVTWIVTWILGLADRHSPMPRSMSMPSLYTGDVITQRVLAVIILIFLVIFFSPGWPAEGPMFRWLNDALAEPSRDRQSAAIVSELDRQAQDWLPEDLSHACRDIMTDNPAQAAARANPANLRTCGEAVRSALEADAMMGREPDPRTESASIRFLLEIAGLAKNGQPDEQFRAFERFARATYPDLRQEGWRQSAQSYLGLLQFPDERQDSQDARADTGYKLSVLAELLYNSDDESSHDMAYRIAAVTGSELSCVPDALRDATNDDGTPVAVPDLPSCLSIVSASGSGDTSWIGFGPTLTKLFIGLLILAGLAIPFVPWPGNFPYVVLYLPLSVLMVLSALG
jgi:hypothetical protein